MKNGKVFFDFSFVEDDEALDGMKVEKKGNIFVSAPGGVWILSADAKLLGNIVNPRTSCEYGLGR